MVDFRRRLSSHNARDRRSEAAMARYGWRKDPDHTPTINPTPTVAPEIVLNEKQAAAMAFIAGGRNILITGQGGSGKSTLLKELRKKYPGLPVTASTGIAALGVGGCTLHSWAGLGLGKEPAEVIAEKQITRKSRAFIAMKMSARLAIDEISMIDASLLDKFNKVLQIIRKNARPFGGIQIIAYGDFLQLPSIGDEDAPAKFAFEADVWREADFKVIVLTEQMRQKDKAFADILSRVRVGDCSDEVRNYLRPRISAVDADPTISPVEITTHNAIADGINFSKLAELTGLQKEYPARDWGKGEHDKARLERDCIAPTTLTLKPGAQVMLLQNLAVEDGLANGTLGIVEGFAKGFAEAPIVKFSNGTVRELERFTWKIERHGEVIATREQYPLRLAWASTSHKIQGQTLDKIRVHLKNCFAPGQAYVALSRVKTIEGLFIADISRSSITAHPTALEFYRRHAA